MPTFKSLVAPCLAFTRPRLHRTAQGLLLAALCVPAAATVAVHDDVQLQASGTVATAQAGVVHYRSEAGLLPIRDDSTGRLMASVFYAGYSAGDAADAARPLTFLWNGGPGSNAAQLHLGVGPKRLDTADRLVDWRPGQNERPLVDNADTWLAASDLVFVDPVGTGFSRAVEADDLKLLYSPHGDAETIAEAIRVYLTRHDAWGRPLYLAGESYGVTRAMLVAEALERRGTPVRGLVLISYDLDLGTPHAAYPDDALNLAQFTAAAHYHQRLAPDLQALDEAGAVAAANAWSRQRYLPSLAAPSTLTAATRAQLLAGLVRYSGLRAQDIDATTLTIPTATFADRLLADRGLELGRYDLRMTQPARAAGTPWLPSHDPSLAPMAGLMNGTSRVFNRYLRSQLGFESDLLYRGPFGNAFHPQPRSTQPDSGLPDDWMAAMWDTRQTIPQGADAPLRRAMDLDPQLRVLSLRGRYDGWPCESTPASTAAAPARYAARVSSLCLSGGHMWYSERASRTQGRRAFEDFLAASSPSSTD